MKSIFFDSGLQHSFDENGYVIVPFLDPQQIAELDSAYHSLSGESGLNKGWHATIHSDNPEYKRKISDAICAEFEHPAKKYVKDYKAVFANFTVKEPNREDSQFDLHLDWSMTDETRFSSLTIWTPLIDITDNNGYLWVLKGSHKLGFTIRGGPGLHTWSENKSREFNPPQFERVILKLKAGEALIYDHRLIHGSPANKSSTLRIAINYTLIPESATSLHYHFHNENEYEIFEVGPDFYLNHPIMTYPENYKSLGRFPVKGGKFLNHETFNSYCIPEVIQ